MLVNVRYDKREYVSLTEQQYFNDAQFFHAVIRRRLVADDHVETEGLHSGSLDQHSLDRHSLDWRSLDWLSLDQRSPVAVM